MKIKSERDRNAKGNPMWNAAGNEEFNKPNEKMRVNISRQLYHENGSHDK